MRGTGGLERLSALSVGLLMLVFARVVQSPTGLAAPRAPAATLPHQVIATVNVGARPVGVGVNPITHKVYVTNASGGSVSVIDGTTDTVVKTIAVDAQPFYWVGVMPGKNRVFVANNTSGTLSVIDGATDTVVGTVSGLSGAPEGVGVHEGRDRAYVTRSGDTLSVVDATARTVLQDVATGAFNRSVVVNPLLDRVYVSKSPPDVLSVFDLATLTKVTDVNVTGHPALDTYTQRIWLTDFRSPRLWLVNGLTNSVDGSRHHGVRRRFLAAIDAPRGCLYATYPSPGLVSVVDIVNRRELGALPVGQSPGGVGVDPTTGRVYVANEGSNTVTVIQGERCDLVGTTTPTPGSTREPYPAPATATPTATVTLVPSETPTATVTLVPSATPTATATLVPSATPTATVAFTPKPGPDPTGGGLRVP